MTATNDDRDTCANCPASAEGCAARQVAKYGRCCTQCTHGRAAADPRHLDLFRTRARTTRGVMGQTHTRPETVPRTEG